MIGPEQQRRAYLQAMGIDVWLPRDADDDASGESPAMQADEGLATGAPPADWDELRACVTECTRCALARCCIHLKGEMLSG